MPLASTFGRNLNAGFLRWNFYFYFILFIIIFFFFFCTAVVIHILCLLRYLCQQKRKAKSRENKKKTENRKQGDCDVNFPFASSLTDYIVPVYKIIYVVGWTRKDRERRKSISFLRTVIT
ncbi:hypothetical protein PUN28_001545 [Cardiocondyla obscurior]|uniref:ATP synthase F0 subunit 8 n=1 Tax=Cardiocondyla obscurior TaxID=286306 RepID=A0AAW2H5X1_9HYME